MRVGWRALAATGLRLSGWLCLAFGLLVLVYQCGTWFVCGVWPPVTLALVFGSGATPLAPLLIALGIVLQVSAGQARRLGRETAGIAPAAR